MKIIPVGNTRVAEHLKSCKECGAPTTTVVGFLIPIEGIEGAAKPTGIPFCDACFANQSTR